jgi:nitroreductase
MIDLLRKRRSIRRFSERPVAADLVAVLEEAVLRAPSGRGVNPWEMVFVDDRATLEALSRARPHGSSFLRHATLAIVVCGDEARSDTWIEDCSIVATIAHLTATSLGLGSCWNQIRMREHAEGVTAESYVKATLGIPDHLRVEAIVGIGYPEADKPGHPRESLDFGKIHRGRY